MGRVSEKLKMLQKVLESVRKSTPAEKPRHAETSKTTLNTN